MDLGRIGEVGGPKRQVEWDVSEPTQSEPIKARFKISQDEIKPGGSFEVAVQVLIAGGYHIYGKTAACSPFTSTTLKLKLPKGIEAEDDWIKPAGAHAKDGAIIYTNAVLFRRKLKVLPDAPAERLPLSAELQYQACNEESCFPPQSVTMEATLNVDSAETRK